MADSTKVEVEYEPLKIIRRQAATTADESPSRVQPNFDNSPEIAVANRFKERTNLRDQLCTLKYRCALSLCILLVLLLETIVRRVEQALQTNSGAYLNGTIIETLTNLTKNGGLAVQSTV